VSTTTALHTLNASSREHPALLHRLLRMTSPGDAVLLIENGVYTLTDKAAVQAMASAGLALYALQADVLARGLDAKNIAVVDDCGFVELACTHGKVVSWFP